MGPPRCCLHTKRLDLVDCTGGRRMLVSLGFPFWPMGWGCSAQDVRDFPFGGPATLTIPHAHLGAPGTCPTPRLGTGSTSFPLSTSHSLAFSEKLNQEMEGTLETLISQGHLDLGLDLIPAPWRPRWKDHLISGVQDQLVTWQDLHLHFNFSKKSLRKNKILVGFSAGLRIQAKAQPALHAGPQPPRGPQAAPSPHSGQEG